MKPTQTALLKEPDVRPYGKLGETVAADITALKADRDRLVQALTAAGATIRGSTFQCPFHDDQNASGSIFTVDGLWFAKCHGCGFSGDVIDVVRCAHALDFAGAMQRLGAPTGRSVADRPELPEKWICVRLGESPQTLLPLVCILIDRMKVVTIASISRGLRLVAAVSLVSSIGLMIVPAVLQSSASARAHILNTLVGLAVGALIADVHVRAIRSSRKWAMTGIGTIVVSQLCFHLWVWTNWATKPMLYRLWWVSAVPAVTSAYFLVLRAASVGRRDLLERGTRLCVMVLGLMLMGLALYRNLPPQPSPVHLWLTALLAIGVLFGSVVAWRRWARLRARPAPMARRARIGWLCASHVLLLLAGFYIGRTVVSTAVSFETLPSALAGLPTEQIDTQVRADLERLRTVVTGINDLTHKATRLESELAEKLTRERRDYYLPEEDDQIRWQFMSYLSYRAALLRLVATYAGFEVVHDADLKARCFMVAYAAAVTTFRTSLQLVTTYRDNPRVRRKLNEPEPLWGIPSGMFDRLLEGVANSRNIEYAAEMAAYFEHRRNQWREAHVWRSEEFDWLESRILDGMAYVRTHRIDPRGATIELFLERVKSDAYTPIYAAQSMLAEWIGDTRIVQRRPLITVVQIEELESKLKPGDILLERRNWCLSNAFLPGFWPHAALYVGRIEDLRRLGVADDPAVKVRLENYLQAAPDGRDHTVIESVSEGVIFSSLTESMHADYVAVLRPLLSDEQIAQAIVRAFRHQGKPYDFEFDFFTADKLVCTELVYRAYEGMLHFDLVRVMGRDTLPALEIVRKFARERELPHRMLDFVLFLDAVPGAQRAEFVTVEDFCTSADRPRAFNE